MHTYVITITVELNNTWPIADQYQLPTVYTYRGNFQAEYSSDLTEHVKHHKALALLSAGELGRVSHVTDIAVVQS